MIEIYAWVHNKPDKSVKGITKITSDVKVVPVTHIKNKYSNRYIAKVYKPEINAPYDLKAHNGECWVYFLKNKNKHVKLPVLNDGEIAEV